MTPRHLPALFLLIFLMIFGPGCGSFKRYPIHKNQYDLTAGLSDRYAASPESGAALLVRQLNIDPVFDTYSFVYRTKDDAYITDYYNEFVSYPARLITEKIREALYLTPFFKSPDSLLKDRIAFRLSGRITKLYADIRNPDKPGVVIEIHMVLEKNSGGQFQPVLCRTYTAEAPVRDRRPSVMVEGWSRGLDKILNAFADDIEKQGL